MMMIMMMIIKCHVSRKTLFCKEEKSEDQCNGSLLMSVVKNI